MRKCSNCNKSNRDNAMFCNHCGEPLFTEGAPPQAEPRGPVDLHGPGQPGAPAQYPSNRPSQVPGQYYSADVNARKPHALQRRRGASSGTVGAVLIGCVMVGLLAFVIINHMKPTLHTTPPPGWRSATQAEWDIISDQTHGRLNAESLFVPETPNQYVNTFTIVKAVDLPGMLGVPDTGDIEAMKEYVNDHRGDFRLGEEFSDEGASERIESVEAAQMDCGQCAVLLRSWTTYAEMGVVEDVILVRKGSKTCGIAAMNVVGANNDLEVTHLPKNVEFE